MQIDTAAAIDLSKEKKQNESSLSDQMKAYIKHPGSGVQEDISNGKVANFEDQVFLHCLPFWVQS